MTTSIDWAWLRSQVDDAAAGFAQQLAGVAPSARVPNLVDDGLLAIEPGRPDRADGTVIADPVAFLLVAQGRASTVRASLAGRIVAYGRHPVKLWRLGRIRAAGI